MINIKNISDSLENYKFCVIKNENIDEAISNAHKICISLSKSYTMYTLNKDSDAELKPHTEMAYHSIPLMYFMILVVSDQSEGGEFVIYDSLKAGETLLKNISEINEVNIKIFSKSRSGSRVRRLLDEEGRNLVYSDPRGIEIYNNKTGFSDEELLSKINESIYSNVLHSTKLKNYDIIIVDNRYTLHSRNAFSGKRLAIRYRLDDPTLNIKENS